METNYLRLTALRNPIFLNPSSKSAAKLIRIGFPHRQSLLRISCTNSERNSSPSNGDIPPPETVEIRFKRGARRKRQLSEEGLGNQQQVKARPAPKKWEDMSIPEKAVELYVGEKGLLFWLNKFAYASIFIIIGAWILFRFVGPALNLYQLDSAPLEPSSLFKGS